MELTVKLFGEHEEILRTITNVALVKCGAIVTLTKDIHGVFEMPEILKKFSPRLFLRCEERGGGRTASGKAQIICGLSGKPLNPFHVFSNPRGKFFAEKAHAIFSVPESVTMISFYRGSKNLNIRNFSLRMVHTRRYVIHESKIWSGKIEDFPVELGKYSNAVAAAVAKASCYHCREPHYIAVKE